MLVEQPFHLGNQRPFAQTLADDLLGLRGLLPLFEGGRSGPQTHRDHSRPSRFLLRRRLLVAPQSLACSIAELLISSAIRLRLLVSFSPFLRDGDLGVTRALVGAFDALRARGRWLSRALYCRAVLKATDFHCCFSGTHIRETDCRAYSLYIIGVSKVL